MDKLFIVMPAYNEAENLEKTVSEWYPVIEKHNGDGESRLIVFNDGSKDNTSQIGKDLEEKYPLFKMIDKSISGHGPTLIQAYKYSVEANGGGYVFQTDSDGQTNPEEFEDFWNQRENYDAIFGNRVVRGDGEQRAFVEKVVCLLVKLFFKVEVPDANAPFRLIKTATLAKYLDKLPENYNLPNIMLVVYFAKFGERICFKEISFAPRSAGTNSINIKKIIKIGYAALGDFSMFKKQINADLRKETNNA